MSDSGNKRHTPGPWMVDRHGYVVDLADVIVASAQYNPAKDPRFPKIGRPAEERAANAALIAAAPETAAERDELRALAEELVAALRDITPKMPPADAPCHLGIVEQQECGNCRGIGAARAALARAAAAGVEVSR